MTLEMIAASASTVIALCALLFSIWQAKVARDHNRISIKPYLTTWISKDHNNGTFSVHVVNNGIGPALIKKYEILVDDKPISGEGTESIEKALKILFAGEPYNADHAYMAPGFSLGAKEKCLVTSVQFLKDFSLSSEQVEHAFSRTDLIIEYESFYGDTDTLDTRIERLKK